MSTNSQRAVALAELDRKMNKLILDADNGVLRCRDALGAALLEEAMRTGLMAPASELRSAVDRAARHADDLRLLQAAIPQLRADLAAAVAVENSDRNIPVRAARLASYDAGLRSLDAMRPQRDRHAMQLEARKVRELAVKAGKLHAFRKYCASYNIPCQ